MNSDSRVRDVTVIIIIKYPFTGTELLNKESSKFREEELKMNKNYQKSGFTLVEIMIVVAIIALLAAIAIPNLLRAKISANDALAQSTVKTMSTAAETFATASNGNYGTSMTSMTSASPAYINKDYCGTTEAGFTFVCTMSAGSYTFVAIPVTVGTSGTTTYTIRTGGILTPI